MNTGTETEKGLVMQPCHPNHLVGGGKKIREFEISLSYVASFSPVWDTLDSVSKNKQEKSEQGRCTDASEPRAQFNKGRKDIINCIRVDVYI